MPPPLIAFISAVGAGIGGVSGAFLVMNAVTLANIALTVGAIAVGNYQRKKAQRKARDAYNANLQDRLVMLATTDGARSRVYGRVRNVDGVLFKATRGSNSEFYTIIVAVAGHEVDAIEQVYFNDELLTLDGSGYVQNAPWFDTESRASAFAPMTVSGGTGSVSLPYTPIGGSVTATNTGGLFDDTRFVLTPSVAGTLVTLTGAPLDGEYEVHYQYNDGRSYARVRSYLGTAAQDLSADLVADFPSLCQSTDKFAGIALLRLDLEYSQDAFPTGVPQVSAVVRGAKVYDTRSTLTAWTANPALIARDWARYAYGGNTTSVSDAAITAAANVCDADTSFVAPSGTVVMDTYQCGIVCKLDADPTASLSEIVESMAGRWGWAGGTLKVMAGAYRAPVDTITDDWVSDAEDVIITPSPPRSELVNSYRVTIANRDNKFQAEPAPPLTPAAYVSADGQQLDAEITMAGVTSILHAQHIAGILLRDARQSLVVQLPCNLRAWKLELFDTVLVTSARFGWTSKLFEVMGWRFTLAGGVLLTLKEANSTVYDVDAGFADLGNDDNSDLPTVWQVAQITGVAVASGTTALTDGSIITRTQVTWTAVADAAVLQSGRIEVQYIEADVPYAGEWPSQIEAGNTTSATIVGLRAGRVYIFRVRAINAAGVRGAWSLHAAHVTALPASVGLTLINDGNCENRGNSIVKTSGGSAWDAGMHSAESFAGGAFASASAPTGQDLMFGLNRSQTTPSYEDIDFAIHLTSVPDARIYEEGVLVATYGAYAVTDVFTVAYDGNAVRYQKNGVTFHQRGAVVSEPLFFDCSLYQAAARLNNVRFGPMARAPRNLIDSRTWVLGSTGSQPGFPEIPTSAGGGNSIQLQTLPDGASGAVWISNAGSAAGTSGEGGWDSDGNFPIDPLRTYRYSVWMRRSGGSTGSLYLGPLINTVNDIGGGLNSNPYFVSHPRSTIPSDAWVLVVGYVLPSTYAGAQLNGGGIWRASDGVKITNGTDFRWPAGQREGGHRSRTFYTDTSGGTVPHYLSFWNPRLELVDGTEPSIQALLAMGSVSGANPITAGNAGVLIGSGAVGTGALATQSATEVFTATGAGGTVSATEANIIGGSSSVLLCAVPTYTNNTGGNVTVQVEAHVDMQVTDSTPAGFGSRFAWVQIEGGVSGVSPQLTTGAIPPYLNADAVPRNYMLVGQVTLGNGASVTPELRAYANVTAGTTPDSTITNSYSPSRLRMTIIKR